MARPRDNDTGIDPTRLRPRPTGRARPPIPEGPRIPDGPVISDGPGPVVAPDRPEAAISSIEEVLGLAGRSVSQGTATRSALDRGALSRELGRKLAAARPRVALTAQQRARLEAMAREAPPVEFRIAPAAAIEPVDLPPGGYDSVVAFRLTALSQVFAALHEAGQLSGGVELTQDQKNLLLAGLRGLFDGTPAGDVGVTAWRLGAPRLVARTAEVAVLRIPFAIDVGPAGGETLASLDGTLQHGVAVRAVVSDDRVTAELEARDLPAGVEFLEVAADSAIRPRSEEDLATFRGALREDVTAALEEEIAKAEEVAICPVISPPVGDAAAVRIQRVDARVQPDDGDGLLVIGILIGSTTEPGDGTGDAQRLRAPSMPGAADLAVRVDEALVHKLVRQAFESGELQKAVDDVTAGLGPKVRVTDAGVDLKAGVAKLLLRVTAVDVCFGFKDVDADAVHEIRLDVFDGKIAIEQESHYDKDNWDVLFCAIAAFFDLLLAALTLVFFPSRLSYYVGLVRSSGGGPARSVVSGIVDPGSPVPGTEVLPTVEALQASISESAIESNGSFTLRPDDTSTFVYARVLEGLRPGTSPVAGVKVQVFDQDVPAPPGDDTPPVPEDSFTTLPKVQTSTTHELRPPTSDQLVAEGETDVLGEVRLRLTAEDRRTSAGTLVTTTTTTTVGNFPGGRGPGGLEAGGGDGRTETHSTTRPVAEPRPDVYFVLRLPDGQVVDTRTMRNRFFRNLGPGRLGSPEEPLDFVVSRRPVVRGTTDLRARL